MKICICANVSDREIAQCLGSGMTFSQALRKTGACQQCMMCETEIAQLAAIQAVQTVGQAPLVMKEE